MRQALGASHWRIVRLVLTESLILGCVGAVLGLLIADWGLYLIRGAQTDRGAQFRTSVSIGGYSLGL